MALSRTTLISFLLISLLFASSTAQSPTPTPTSLPLFPSNTQPMVMPSLLKTTLVAACYVWVGYYLLFYYCRNYLKGLFPLKVGPKKKHATDWYQSLVEGMEQQMGNLETTVQSFSGGQQALAKQVQSLSGGQQALGGDTSSVRGSHSRTTPTNSNASSAYTLKPIRLDFPWFKGEEDPTSWLCRVEQFFNFHEKPNEERVSIASFHLEDEAQLWFQLLKEDKLEVSWDDFKEGLYSRYGPNQYLDFFGDLAKLQQKGSVQAYQVQFEKLFSKVGWLAPERKVSCFISGLQDSICIEVQVGRPRTLLEVIGLSRLYEAKSLTQRKMLMTPKQGGPPTRPASTTTSPTVKRLSVEELNERRKLGLCFRCNGQFGPGHRCKKPVSIQAMLDKSDEDVEMEVENQDSLDIPAISIHALAGTPNPRTMRMRGKTCGHVATVLIDYGSTHNFINDGFTATIGLQPVRGGCVEMLIASGERLKRQGFVPEIPPNKAPTSSETSPTAVESDEHVDAVASSCSQRVRKRPVWR
ncbi:hypothetical protein Pint_31690 [Pistacia integerrima]|uniref:Uncharacterized protein n=1 Tax=Pistacia integerrima TaxID=434235 RepID=A0ACC0XSJ8_9ROSI|nr:hypothetical protein Pint_31690 [Pistacia integerrima]